MGKKYGRHTRGGGGGGSGAKRRKGAGGRKTAARPPLDASREARPELAAEANAPEVEAVVESPDETEQPLLEAPEVADRDESHEDSREVVKLKAIVASLQAAMAQLKEKRSTQNKKFKALKSQCGDLVLTSNAEDIKWRKLYRSRQRRCLRLASSVDGAAAEADAEAEAEAERAADAECTANTARVLAFAKLVAATVSRDAEAEVEALLDNMADMRPQRPKGPQSILVTLLDEPAEISTSGAPSPTKVAMADVIMGPLLAQLGAIHTEKPKVVFWI
eukprot:jgi/Tetstr1/421134/TSEL_012177.t1